MEKNEVKASINDEKEEDLLWEEFKKTKSAKLRDKFIRQYMPLVKYVAGKVSVGMLEAGPENPLFAVKGGENAFVFETARYTPIPLTIRGYGAGADVTAAGVFGDVLRTVSFNPEV